MVLIQHLKWMYAAAGSGIAIGLYNYIQSEKQLVQASWTTNFEPSVKWDYNWDKRDLFSLIKPAKNEVDPKDQNRVLIEEREKMNLPPRNRHIFLIRHGQYDEDADDDKDRKLTPLGRKQAEYVGQRLKELQEHYQGVGVDFKYTKLYRSTMTRAIETSDIILEYFPDLPNETDDLLREGSPIPPEPPSEPFRPEYQYYEAGPRIEAAFRKYFHRADAKQDKSSREIVVCHANVIRYFLCRALQIPPEAWLRFGLSNGSITWIMVAPSGDVVVLAVGDFGFQPKGVITRK